MLQNECFGSSLHTTIIHTLCAEDFVWLAQHSSSRLGRAVKCVWARETIERFEIEIGIA
jgi:hypothetical protein